MQCPECGEINVTLCPGCGNGRECGCCEAEIEDLQDEGSVPDPNDDGDEDNLQDRRDIGSEYG